MYDRSLIFLHSFLFLASSKKYASGKFLWPLLLELWPCSRGFITIYLMQIFPFVNLKPKLSSFFRRPCYPWRLKSNLAVKQARQLTGDPYTVYRVVRPCTPYRPYDVIIYCIINDHENAYVNNSSQNGVRAMREVFFYAKPRRLICTMTFLGNLSAQVTWPDRKSDFQIDLSSVGVSMHMIWCTRREKHDSVKHFSLPHLVRKLFAKKCS